MDWKLLFCFAYICLAFANLHRSVCGQASTERPDTNKTSNQSDEEIEDDGPDDSDEACPQVAERALMAAEYFPDPISRERGH